MSIDTRNLLLGKYANTVDKKTKKHDNKCDKEHPERSNDPKKFRVSRNELREKPTNQ